MKIIYLKILLYLIFISLVIFQISFLNNSPWMEHYFNLILIMLFAFLLIFSYRYLFLYVLTAGFIFDLYSQFPFGLYLFSFTLTVLILYLLLKQVLTHYSLFAFLSLAALGTITFNLFLYLPSKIIYLINLNDYYFNWSWGHLAGQLMVNLIILGLIVNRYELQKSF